MKKFRGLAIGLLIFALLLAGAPVATAAAVQTSDTVAAVPAAESGVGEALCNVLAPPVIFRPICRLIVAVGKKMKK